MRLLKEIEYKIFLKEESEIQIMREGGKILGQVLFELEKLVQPGISTREINAKAEKMIDTFEVKASFKGYQGFPAATCISVNNEIVHGIPGDYIIKDKDIVKIDCGVLYKGFNTDSAICVQAGQKTGEAQDFIETAKKALYSAIEIAQPGTYLSELGKTIQRIAEKNGYSVVRDLTGHGVGKGLHEDPPVLNFYLRGNWPRLVPGMTLAIEPIFSMGKPEMKILKDGWTYVTVDGSYAVQVEHTIVITEKGPEILTLSPDQ